MYVWVHELFRSDDVMPPGRYGTNCTEYQHKVTSFTGNRRIPLTKASDAELSCFLWSAHEKKRLRKQSRRRWFETPSRSLWRHCNVFEATPIVSEPRIVWFIELLLCILGNVKLLRPSNAYVHQFIRASLVQIIPPCISNYILVACSAIFWTNAGILSFGCLGTQVEILIEIQRSSLKKMHVKMSSLKWWPLCLCLTGALKEIKGVHH